MMAMVMIPLMIAGGFDGVEPLDEAKCYVCFGNPFTGKAIERFHSELKKRLSKEAR